MAHMGRHLLAGALVLGVAWAHSQGAAQRRRATEAAPAAASGVDLMPAVGGGLPAARLRFRSLEDHATRPALVAGDLLASDMLAGGGALEAGDALAGASMNFLWDRRADIGPKGGFVAWAGENWVAISIGIFVCSVICCCSCWAVLRFSATSSDGIPGDTQPVLAQGIHNDVVKEMRTKRLLLTQRTVIREGGVVKEIPDAVREMVESAEFKAKCSRIFFAEDKDRSGTLDLSEFKYAILDLYGDIKTDKYFMMAFENSWGSGRVNEDEFCEMMMLFEYQNYLMERGKEARRSPQAPATR